MADEGKDIVDQWLSIELNRIWLLAERALRAFQRAQIRPQPGHPSIAEVEAIFSARRTARKNGDGTPDEEDALTKAIDAVEASLGAIRKKSQLGRLIQNLELRPLEV